MMPTLIGDNRLKFLKSKCSKVYSLPKYIVFIQICQELGLRVALNSSNTTRSHYVTVNLGAKKLKVRFSNHKPRSWNKADIFVGMNKKGRFRSTVSALNLILKQFFPRHPKFKKLPNIERCYDDELFRI